jgi:glycosyltransferase involved in cell wall biosynthesis
VISVIVCSRQDPAWDFHARNVDKTIGADYEYVRIDNRAPGRGICAAYNEGVSRAAGDICVFVHEDVFFMEPGWGSVLRTKFSADASIGLIGVAGTQYLFADDVRWHTAGPPFTRGRVIHELDTGAAFILTVLSWDKSDADVVVVDGLFFAVRRSLFEQIRFDDATFPAFHFYDLDISMQVRKTHRCVVTWDIMLKHLSAGKNDPAWFAGAERFRQKYSGSLPASCAKSVPDPKNLQAALNYDLRNKVPQVTIM